MKTLVAIFITVILLFTVIIFFFWLSLISELNNRNTGHSTYNNDSVGNDTLCSLPH